MVLDVVQVGGRPTPSAAVWGPITQAIPSRERLLKSVHAAAARRGSATRAESCARKNRGRDARPEFSLALPLCVSLCACVFECGVGSMLPVRGFKGVAAQKQHTFELRRPGTLLYGPQRVTPLALNRTGRIDQQLRDLHGWGKCDSLGGATAPRAEKRVTRRRRRVFPIVSRRARLHLSLPPSTISSS